MLGMTVQEKSIQQFTIDYNFSLSNFNGKQHCALLQYMRIPERFRAERVRCFFVFFSDPERFRAERQVFFCIFLGDREVKAAVN